MFVAALDFGTSFKQRERSVARAVWRHIRRPWSEVARALRALRAVGNNATNESGQAAGSTTPIATLVAGVTSATRVSADASSSCALLEDGTVSCWGNIGASPTPTRTAVPSLTDIARIDTGGPHCALDPGGVVRCWGSGLFGNGNGSETRTTPIAMSGLTDVVGLASGGGHTCALLGDATLTCWGPEAAVSSAKATPSRHHAVRGAGRCNVGVA